MDSDLDLVFVEFIANDVAWDKLFDNPSQPIFERLLRKLLNRPNHPAVVLMQVRAGL